MFTVSRLGIDGRLEKTLTNANASMISIARTVAALARHVDSATGVEYNQKTVAA